MRRIAKLFMNGRSQAVRLPVDFRFESKEVFILKILLRAMLFSRVNRDLGMIFLS